MANTFQKTMWESGYSLVQEGAGWYTAVGIVRGSGKPFVRVARGKAIPGGDPETGAPVKQAQKFNIKSWERWQEIKAAIDAQFEILQEMGSYSRRDGGGK